MLYAKLNDRGEVVDVATRPSEEYKTLVAPDDPKVAAILESKIDVQDSQEILDSSDVEMMRVLEDLVDLLVEKRLIQFTELPMAAQKKLLSRKWVRGVRTGSEESLIQEETSNGHDSFI